LIISPGKVKKDGAEFRPVNVAGGNCLEGKLHEEARLKASVELRLLAVARIEIGTTISSNRARFHDRCLPIESLPQVDSWEATGNADSRRIVVLFTGVAIEHKKTRFLLNKLIMFISKRSPLLSPNKCSTRGR
jgi:hypothetical protein